MRGATEATTNDEEEHGIVGGGKGGGEEEELELHFVDAKHRHSFVPSSSRGPGIDSYGALITGTNVARVPIEERRRPTVAGSGWKHLVSKERIQCEFSTRAVAADWSRAAAAAVYWTLHNVSLVCGTQRGVHN